MLLDVGQYIKHPNIASLVDVPARNEFNAGQLEENDGWFMARLRIAQQSLAKGFPKLEILLEELESPLLAQRTEVNISIGIK